MAYDADDPMPTNKQLGEYNTRATAALDVPCTYCGAQPGQYCRNKITGLPLDKFITHLIRQKDAANHNDPDDELPF